MKLTDERLSFIRKCVEGYPEGHEVELLEHINAITAEYNEELNRLSAERDMDSSLIMDLGRRLKEANEKNKRLEEQQNAKC